MIKKQKVKSLFSNTHKTLLEGVNNLIEKMNLEDWNAASVNYFCMENQPLDYENKEDKFDNPNYLCAYILFEHVIYPSHHEFD